MDESLNETTPAISVRNLRFNRNTDSHPRWWVGGDPVPTAFFNALSCTFPAGEKFFMDSVRAQRHLTPPSLKAQIKDFCAQEAIHSREHAVFNNLAAKAGYPVEQLEARTKRVLDFARGRSPLRQLAATCALEHFTAILAAALLAADSKDLDGAPDEARQLWNWHAIEEIEHKAVAYDTFMVATAHMTAIRRYALRIMAMLLATAILFSTMRRNIRDLYREDGLSNRHTWARTIGYLFGRSGILRRIVSPYLSYYKPGFHPLQHDDNKILASAKAQSNLEAYA